MEIEEEGEESKENDEQEDKIQSFWKSALKSRAK